MSEKEIVAAAKSDPDAQPTALEFWKDAKVVLPERKQPVTLRIDCDVLPPPIDGRGREQAQRSRVRDLDGK